MKSGVLPHMEPVDLAVGVYWELKAAESYSKLMLIGPVWGENRGINWKGVVRNKSLNVFLTLVE